MFHQKYAIFILLLAIFLSFSEFSQQGVPLCLCVTLFTLNESKLRACYVNHQKKHKLIKGIHFQGLDRKSLCHDTFCSLLRFLFKYTRKLSKYCFLENIYIAKLIKRIFLETSFKR